MKVSEKIRLFPTEEQELRFRQFAGTARFVYNACLAHKKEVYANSGYSSTVDDLNTYIHNLEATSQYSWLLDIPNCVTRQAVKDLDTAYKNFFARGNKGFPKFKSKRFSKMSFYERADRFYQVDSTHIKFTGIKAPVRIREHSAFPKMYNIRITFDGKFWYMSYAFDITPLPKSTSDEVIGVDLGVKNLATVSDSRVYKNINKSKRVKQLEKRKRHLQRKLSNKYEINKQGTKFVKTNNILKLEHQVRLLDRKLKNIRDTYLHQVTYDLVKSKPSRIVIEDLNVSGMLKNKHLSKSIQEQCFYKFRQYLTYKCEFYGTELVVADRFYPSSKTCSCCGAVRGTLSLSERTFICPSCGASLDRDLNAAINLRNYAVVQ